MSEDARRAPVVGATGSSGRRDPLRLNAPVSRRALLGAGAVVGVGALTASLTASSRGGDTADAAWGTPTGAATTSRRSQPPARHSTVLLAYFSRAGEQYWNGGRRTVGAGNTAVIAGMIRDLVAVDVYEIKAAHPYPSAYEPTVTRNWRDVQADARPAIAHTLPALAGYKTILLGNPVWAMQEPMIMRTFIEGLDGLAGKAVHPFVTYAVSQMGSVMDDYTRLYPKATFSHGLAIRGEDARHSAPDVRTWLSRIGLLYHATGQ